MNCLARQRQQIDTVFPAWPQSANTLGVASPVLKLIGPLMDDRVDEPVLKLSEDRLLLLDRDGKTVYDWTRVKTQP